MPEQAHKSDLIYKDPEAKQEILQLKEWPQDLKFPDDPDPGDWGIIKLSPKESLSPTATTACSCVGSMFAEHKKRAT